MRRFIIKGDKLAFVILALIEMLKRK